jgi:hypothetical protein
MVKVSDMLTGQRHVNPRGNSFAAIDAVDKHCAALAVLFDQDKLEEAIAGDLRAYVEEHLRPDVDLYIAVFDRLAARKIITKLKFREYLTL